MSSESAAIGTSTDPSATAHGTAAVTADQPVGASRRRGPFREGERVQLTDERGRMNTISLEAGGAFHTHRGFLNHDDIIGKVDGSVVVNNVGQQYQTLRPLLSDFVLSMPRGAAGV